MPILINFIKNHKTTTYSKISTTNTLWNSSQQVVLKQFLVTCLKDVKIVTMVT